MWLAIWPPQPCLLSRRVNWQVLPVPSYIVQDIWACAEAHNLRVESNWRPLTRLASPASHPALCVQCDCYCRTDDSAPISPSSSSPLRNLDVSILKDGRSENSVCRRSRRYSSLASVHLSSISSHSIREPLVQSTSGRPPILDARDHRERTVFAHLHGDSGYFVLSG